MFLSCYGGVYDPILYPSKDYACLAVIICFITLVDASVFFEIPEDR